MQEGGSKEYCAECDTPANTNHTPSCPIMIMLDLSYEQDRERWIEGYIVVPTRLRLNVEANS